MTAGDGIGSDDAAGVAIAIQTGLLTVPDDGVEHPTCVVEDRADGSFSGCIDPSR